MTIFFNFDKISKMRLPQLKNDILIMYTMWRGQMIALCLSLTTRLTSPHVEERQRQIFLRESLYVFLPSGRATVPRRSRIPFPERGLLGRLHEADHLNRRSLAATTAHCSHPSGPPTHWGGSDMARSDDRFRPIPEICNRPPLMWRKDVGEYS